MFFTVSPTIDMFNMILILIYHPVESNRTLNIISVVLLLLGVRQIWDPCEQGCLRG